MVTIIAYAFLVIGFIFISIGAIGIWKFDQIFTRIHALSLIDNIGVNTMLVGLMLIQDNYISMLKIFAMIILICLFGPVSCHAIANAAYHNKDEKSKEDGIFN